MANLILFREDVLLCPLYSNIQCVSVKVSKFYFSVNKVFVVLYIYIYLGGNISHIMIIIMVWVYMLVCLCCVRMSEEPGLAYLS